MKNMGNKPIRVLIAVVLALLIIAAGLLAGLSIRTGAILDDYSSVYQDEKYSIPVYVDGIDVIKQDISCGYAVIEMFSSWCGKDITEESLYSEYGKVVTSTGKRFCEEMNKQFPEYTTTIHKYMKNTELIDTVYNNLSNGVPVPFEWAALYDDVWTLHYSLIVGMDIPGDKVTIANPYGYYEDISLSEFLDRTSLEGFADGERLDRILGKNVESRQVNAIPFEMKRPTPETAGTENLDDEINDSDYIINTNTPGEKRLEPVENEEGKNALEKWQTVEKRFNTIYGPTFDHNIQNKDGTKKIPGLNTKRVFFLLAGSLGENMTPDDIKTLYDKILSRSRIGEGEGKITAQEAVYGEALRFR